jgi:membrane fusion protein (multidrug efflux system)
VRVSLQADEVKAHPLRVGLSMEVEVDVAQQDGAMLAIAPRDKPVASTSVFDAPQADADKLVARIIDGNLHRKGSKQS